MKLLKVLILALLLSFTTFAQSGTNNNSSVKNAVTVSAGTLTKLELDTPISSKLNEIGDEVSARLVNSIFINGQLALKRGTEFRGKITQISPAKRGQRQASLAIVFDKIVIADGEQEVATLIKAIDDYANESKLNANDEGTVKGGRAGGRTVDNATRGVILGGATYPAILAGTGSLGAAASAPLGGALAGVLFSKGNDIKLFPGTILRIEITKPIIVNNQDTIPNQSNREERDNDN